MRWLRRLRENVPPEIPQAGRRSPRVRSSALHPVFLLSGTLPEGRHRAADDTDDAGPESGRQVLPSIKNLQRKITIKYEFSTKTAGNPEKMEKKLHFFRKPTGKIGPVIV